MPVPTINIVKEHLTLPELVNEFAKMQKLVRYHLTKGLESVNMIEVGGWKVENDMIVSEDGDCGMSSIDSATDDVRFFASPVDDGTYKFAVYKSGKLYAVEAYIEGKIASSLIVGSEIRTDEEGYPRIILSSTNRLLSAEASEDNYIRLIIDAFGQVMLKYVAPGVDGFWFASDAQGAVVYTSINGGLSLSPNGDLSLKPSTGKVKFSSWDNVIKDGNVSLQNEFDSLRAPIIAAGTYTVITVGSDGRATAGRELTASDIPSGISAAKISDGSVTNDQFKELSIANRSAFDVHQSGTAQTIPSGAYTKVLFNSKSYDNLNEFDTTTSRFTCLTSGIYLVDINVGFDFSINTDMFVLQLFKNGTGVKELLREKAAGGTDYSAHGTTQIRLNAGDYLEVIVYCTASRTLYATPTFTYFSATKIVG